MTISHAFVKCSKCKVKLSYNERYDAYFCATCNEWCEKTCSDKKCFYCKNRPIKPVRIIL